MPPPEEARRALVDEWLAGADEDYGVAEHLLVTSPHFARAIGFHAQQAAEKFLKAYLTWHQVEFAKTHDLTEILGLVARTDPGLSATLQDARLLTPFAVRTRYPGPASSQVPRGAASAVRIAERVRDAILASLRSVLGPDPPAA
jgi:HEPN domain-containing protein